jgi:hypothetical protein
VCKGKHLPTYARSRSWFRSPESPFLFTMSIAGTFPQLVGMRVRMSAA